MSSGQEMFVSPAIPRPCIRRFQSATSAAPTRTFFGSQPRRAQVPPYGSSSTTATLHPAFRHRYVAAEPPLPAPIPLRSNGSAIRPLCPIHETLGFDVRHAPFGGLLSNAGAALLGDPLPTSCARATRPSLAGPSAGTPLGFGERTHRDPLSEACTPPVRTRRQSPFRLARPFPVEDRPAPPVPRDPCPRRPPRESGSAHKPSAVGPRTVRPPAGTWVR